MKKIAAMFMGLALCFSSAPLLMAAEVEQLPELTAPAPISEGEASAASEAVQHPELTAPDPISEGEKPAAMAPEVEQPPEPTVPAPITEDEMPKSETPEANRLVTDLGPGLVSVGETPNSATLKELEADQHLADWMCDSLSSIKPSPSVIRYDQAIKSYNKLRDPQTGKVYTQLEDLAEVVLKGESAFRNLQEMEDERGTTWIVPADYSIEPGYDSSYFELRRTWLNQDTDPEEFAEMNPYLQERYSRQFGKYHPSVYGASPQYYEHLMAALQVYGLDAEHCYVIGTGVLAALCFLPDGGVKYVSFAELCFKSDEEHPEYCYGAPVLDLQEVLRLRAMEPKDEGPGYDEDGNVLYGDDKMRVKRVAASSVREVKAQPWLLYGVLGLALVASCSGLALFFYRRQKKA